MLIRSCLSRMRWPLACVSLVLHSGKLPLFLSSLKFLCIFMNSFCACLNSYGVICWKVTSWGMLRAFCLNMDMVFGLRYEHMKKCVSTLVLPLCASLMWVGVAFAYDVVFVSC